MDLPATILDYAGAARPAGFHGRSLRPLAAGGTADWENAVFMQISESQVGRAVRTPEWKYSVRAHGKNNRTDMDSDTYTEDFLYDLAKDPHEQNNLIADPAYGAVREEMRALLFKKMAEAGEQQPTILPAAE